MNTPELIPGTAQGRIRGLCVRHIRPFEHHGNSQPGRPVLGGRIDCAASEKNQTPGSERDQVLCEGPPQLTTPP